MTATRAGTGLRRRAVVSIATLSLTVCVLDDLLFQGDPIDLATARPAEIVPGAPWILPGPDGRLGKGLDEIRTDVVGDIDLVVRSGIVGFRGPIPDPTAGPDGLDAPRGVAEPFGAGTPIAFVVAASDGSVEPRYGNPIAAPSLEEAPVVVVAFADLDGDGFIGNTRLDGRADDDTLEEAEFVPVGRRVAIARGGRASGRLFLAAGGPTGAELRVALAAAAWAGPFDPEFFNGAVPDGPAVLTQVPFLPRLAPQDVLGGALPWPADPDALIEVQVEPAVDPDPGDPRFGEAFTIRLDGSEPTVDLAIVRSGAFARFGLAQRPDPDHYRHLPARPLRPGLAEDGTPTTYEILQRLFVADDGDTTRTAVRVVPLDRQGNVADLDEPSEITVRAAGGVEIAWPDHDGNPKLERLRISDTRGVELLLDDAGERFDGPDGGRLVVEGAGALVGIEVFLPDPDVNDDGVVDRRDLELVDRARGLRLGEAGFETRLDVDADGRIRSEDVKIIRRFEGERVSIP